MKWLLGALAALALPLSASTALAEDELDYRVTFEFTHLGEVIARPQLDLESGETGAGHYTVPDGARYRIAARVEPAGNGEVAVSFQFTSGNVDIQPNVRMALNELFSGTEKKIAYKVFVEPLNDEE